MEEKTSWFKKVICRIEQQWGETDLYRDSPIRCLGYANEIGEALRAWVPHSLVAFTYVVASGYVLADAFDKGHKVHKLNRDHDRKIRRKETALTVFDVMVWQAFASVIIPGYTINRLCALSTFIFERYQKVPRPLARLSTTLIGLAAIPIIIKPIDAFVDTAMDTSIRKYYAQSPSNFKLVEK